MIFFLCFTLVLTLASLALFAWTLRSSTRRSTRADHRLALGKVQAELDLLRIQRQEFESDLQNHNVDAHYREQMLSELSVRAQGLLAHRDVLEKNLEARDGSVVASGIAKPWLHASLGVFMIVLAFGLYAWLGNPAALGLRAAQPLVKEKIDVAQLVAKLEEKLNERPDQPEGWLLLGNTKAKLGNYAGAIDAYGKAIAIVDRQNQSAERKQMLPDLFANLAEVTMLKNQDQPQSASSLEALRLAEDALHLDPMHQKALVLAATLSMRIGQVDQARGYWQTLAQTLPQDSSERAEVETVLASLNPDKNAAEVKTPNSASTQAKSNAGEARIEGSVDLSTALKTQLKTGDILFIFARRPASTNSPTGARMPLAVARFPLSSAADLAQWPRNFSLSDEMAMAAGGKLSDVDQVEVVARISHTGSALAASGDLTSAAVLVPTKKISAPTALKLTIDRLVP